MLELNFVAVFTTPLDRLRIPYMISGSVAAIIYGEPRLTNDVDLIVVLNRENGAALADAFPLSDFYCPPAEVIAVEAAREQRGHFNIIHHKSGFKADMYLSGCDPLHAWGLANSNQIQIKDDAFVIAPPEYVIVRKLEYFREGGSGKHLRDIRAMLNSTPELANSQTLNRLVSERGLADTWQQVWNASLGAM